MRMDDSSNTDLVNEEEDESVTVVKLERNSKARPGNRHRKIECKVCLRVMHSQNLKRHMLKHRELYVLDEDEIREEIKRRKILHETREEREKLIKKIAEEEGYHADKIDDESPSSIEEELIKDDEVFTRKIEYGEKIATILEKGIVQEESLSRSNMEALKLFRKQMSSKHLVQPT